jgi:hypothetical protein
VAYDYLDENNLADALNDSEVYTRDYYKHIPELQRLTRAKPGKIPEGKPRVTDGTLAAIRRESPKQIIQQIPTGKAVMKGFGDMEGLASGVLTDIILPNANSGGTPYAKAKKAIRNQHDVGSAWAECFYNRRGDLFYADYRIKFYADILFEKGKVSEFDTNFMPVIDWMTEGDLKAIIWQEKQRQYTKTEWNLKAIQELLDKGPTEKDEQSKTPEEKKASNQNGFFKIVKFYQIGVKAKFYYYAPTIKKVVYSCVSKDPRGIIPVHGLVAEEDDDSPLGEPLARYSAGKQNLLDFDMQMYQYGQGMNYSPTLKKWGQTPAHRIKIAPDNVIELDGTPQTDDVQVLNAGNQATANYGNNQGLIKSQIYNEMGHRTDTSIGAESGAPGYSRTPAGVKAGKAVTDIVNNDLNQTYELWQGRVFETLLNIHFAYSEGKKEIDLEADTLKRLNLKEAPSIDYGKEYGKIKFRVDASTSKAADAETENKKLIELMDVKTKLQNPDDKDMQMYNQIVTNAGVTDPDRLKYTDEEIQTAQQMRLEQTQMAHENAKLALQQAATAAQNAAQPQQPAAPPQQPKTLGESVAWKPGDLKPAERAQALAQVGIQADTTDPNPTPNEVAQATDTATKIDKHSHDTAIAASNHANSMVDEPELVDNAHEEQLEPMNVRR